MRGGRGGREGTLHMHTHTRQKEARLQQLSPKGGRGEERKSKSSRKIVQLVYVTPGIQYIMQYTQQR